MSGIFLWGAATSAHQVEGDNVNSDWWQWEMEGRTRERSGKACEHYKLYEQDFTLAKSLNHNAHRFSVEWSRIEPQEGVFDEEALRHYRSVVSALLSRQIEPVVTLHHFTNPVWFSKLGGWGNPKAVGYFTRYAEYIVAALEGKVRFWLTINEPMVNVYRSYIEGQWPPGGNSYDTAVKVLRNLLLAHSAAYDTIHKIYKRNGWPHPMVSFAKSAASFVPCSSRSWRDRYSARIRHSLYNHFIFRSIRNGFLFFPGLYFEMRPEIKGRLDYIALNYYLRDFVHFDGLLPPKYLGRICSLEHHKDAGERNSLGWEVYPEGLSELLMQFKRYNLPIMITENGICTDDDTQRWRYIKSHLIQLKRAIDNGADIIGYLYWSLLDNLEWAEGFSPRFGLIEVDYDTQTRKARQSALKFAEICRNGLLGLA